METWIYGRDCELGYGCDWQLNTLVPFQCAPDSQIKGSKLTPILSVNCISDKQLTTKSKISLLVDDRYLLWLEHQIIDQKGVFYLIDYSVLTSSTACKSCDKYPENVAGYISQVERGTNVVFVISQAVLPEGKNKVHTVELWIHSVMDGEDTLSASHQKVKCNVLINRQTTREMAFKDVVQLVKDVRTGKNTQFEAPIRAFSKALNNALPKTVQIANEGDFKQFLSYLYVCYRKIEIARIKQGCPVASVQQGKGQTLGKIVNRLENAKNGYKNLDKSDVERMYPAMKQLFFCFKDYLKFCIDNKVDVKEGETLPGDIGPIRDLMASLNSTDSVAGEIPGSCKTSKSACLLIPEGFQGVEQKMSRAMKSHCLTVVRDSALAEPRLRMAPDVNGLFGFVNMTGAAGDANPSKKKVFENSCPKQCTQDSRKWICTACGNPVRLNLNKLMLLVCDCGSKQHNESLFTCTNPIHEETLLIEQLPETLRRIVNQLKKHQNRYDEGVNADIKEAIKILLKNDKTTTIKAVLRKLQLVNVFDGDTNRLFTAYLS